MINTNEFIETLYQTQDFFKLYNPLKNLKWDDDHGIWINRKIYSKKMEPIYPEMFSKQFDED